MLFWTIAAGMTLVASVAVMLPFLRSSAPVTADTSAFDIEVYRDQLRELERETERGLVMPAEAEEARAEIGRRILRESDRSGSGGGKAQGRGPRMTAAAAILAVPLVSWGLYAALGSPGLPSEPLQARLMKNPKDSTIEELVARAESHLAKNPEDGRGWDVLAPVYFRLSRYKDAVTAYRHAIRLSGATAGREAGLGEAVTASNDGIVSSEAEAAFRRAVAIDPGDAKSHFFLAMAQAQEGDIDKATAMWTRMQADLPAASPWRGAIKQAMAELPGAQEKQNEPGAGADPGPSGEEVAAASQMAPEDRMKMIEGMVARLDRRLRDNPDDRDGWQRLVRSYMVLDRKAEAEAALENGLAALGPDTENGKALKAFAASLGIVETR